MASEIKPGQWVTVKVTSEPRAAARRKTLVRLFEQDPTVRNERKRLARSRQVGSHRRGGRFWADRPAQLKAAPIKPGATYKLFASVAVLRDLQSVARYVEIAPA